MTGSTILNEFIRLNAEIQAAFQAYFWGDIKAMKAFNIYDANTEKMKSLQRDFKALQDAQARTGEIITTADISADKPMQPPQTTIEKLLVDMTDCYRTTGLKAEYYLKILDKIKEFQPPTPTPEPQKTVITYTIEDGLYIERPEKQGFTIWQRLILASVKWIAIIFVAAALLVRGLAV